MSKFLKEMSPKSVEFLNTFADSFYTNHSKALIADNIKGLIKQSIPVEGEVIEVDTFSTIMNSATELMTSDAISSKIITLDEKASSAEHYLDAVSQICNKYAGLETKLRRQYVQASVESGKVPNYEENSKKYEAFLNSVFEIKAFSREDIKEAYELELENTKSLEEENIADTIKERVKSDITETEENNKLFSDIIEEVESVKKEYDDADTTDGKPVKAEDDPKEDDMGGDMGDTGGMDDGMGTDDGSGEEGGEEVEGDVPEGEEGTADGDIPLGEEGYDTTNIHSNKTPMRRRMSTEEEDDDEWEESDDNEPAYKTAMNNVSKAINGKKKKKNNIMSMDSEEDDIDIDYEDNEATSTDDAYEPPEDTDANIDNIEQDAYDNEDTGEEDWNDDFAREEEEVFREIADSFNVKLDTHGDSEEPEQEINPLRGTSSSVLEISTEDVVSSAETQLLSAEQIAGKMIDTSLLKFSMLPNYSAESITNMFMRIDNEKKGKLKDIIKRRIDKLEYSTEYESNNPNLVEKLNIFKDNWTKATEDLFIYRMGLLSELGIGSREVFSKENIMSLAITKNLLNSYSSKLKTKKLPSVCSTLKINDETMMKKEKLIDTLFDLGRKAKHIMTSYDIAQAREDFIEQEKEAEKQMDDLLLDESEVDMTDNLKALLKHKDLKKFFHFDSLLLSYKTIFGTIEEKMKLSDSLKEGVFNEKVVNNIRDKRGFLSREEIDLVNRYIAGQDISNYHLNTYGKFNIILARSAEDYNSRNYANIAVESKLLTTIYHTKAVLLPGYDMSKEDTELDEKINDLMSA